MNYSIKTVDLYPLSGKKRAGVFIYLFTITTYTFLYLNLTSFISLIVISDICSMFLFIYLQLPIISFLFIIYLLLFYFKMVVFTFCFFPKQRVYATEKHNRLFPLPLWRTSCLLKTLKDYVWHAVGVSSARNRMISYQGHLFLIYQRNLISSKTDWPHFPPSPPVLSLAFSGTAQLDCSERLFWWPFYSNQHFPM